MNTKNDNAYLNEYTDNVIKRGYEIYDEWIEKKHDSRKIVASAEGAVKLFKKRKTMSAFIEALAYIFAFDLRIKEKYNNLLRCLFSYFSWRRETRAFNTLKTEINIPLNESDIRNAIAVMIEKLAEKLENDPDEDGDDEAHGGKRNGKAEEEAATEEKEIGTEDTAEEKNEAEELTDKEEKGKDSEEKEEPSVEEATKEETKEEKGEKKEAEEQRNETEKTVEDKKEKSSQEKSEVLKEDNNGPEERTEPSNDKPKESKTHDDAIDSTPLYEIHGEDKSEANKTSFIDEVIIDNMVKGREDFIHHNPLNDFKADNEVVKTDDALNQSSQESKSENKDDYLYDKTVTRENDSIEQSGTNAIEEKSEAKQEEATKNEAKQETSPKNENTVSVRQEKEEMRVPLQIDINESQENDMRKELADNMSLEVIKTIINAQKEAAREQMRIAELETDAPVEISKKTEPVQANQVSVSYSKK